MKFYICDASIGKLKIVKEISLSEFESIRKCVEQLKYYTMTKHFKEIAIKNGTELYKYLIKVKNITDIEVIKKAINQMLV